MHKPKLSITIPTWNRAVLLEEQILLLSEQIIKNDLSKKIEIVISDNGSDDSTQNIILNILEKYDFIIYHNNEINKGARYNLLKALDLANGEYSIFLGDDDRYKIDGLKKMIDCIEKHNQIDAIFDSHLFKRNKFKQPTFVSLDQLLENFYYNIGNAGVFIIRTSLLQANINKFGYNYFSLSWPQTQLIILSLNHNDSKKILLADLDLFNNSVHDQVMMYNSYYLLRGLYFDLADAIDSIKTEIALSNYNSARQFLKNQILQNTFNVLQCGVYVDNYDYRKKTIDYIKLHKSKFSFEEQFFLTIALIVLSLPIWLSRILSDIFIFTTRGKRGLEKKNNFVTRELQKLQNKNINKSIRTFDFTT